METALNTIRSLSNERLLAIWDETEKQITTLETYDVRGWIMQVMQERDPQGFDRWMDNEDITRDDPKYYLFN